MSSFQSSQIAVNRLNTCSSTEKKEMIYRWILIAYTSINVITHSNWLGKCNVYFGGLCCREERLSL